MGAITLALAGDTMLGRSVGDRLRANPSAALVDRPVAEAAAAADAFVLNLECCISQRGERFPDPRKPFFFRAPPVAAERLAELGVDAVTLANNHALDYGPLALLDTLDALGAAGIAVVGAGADEAGARSPIALEDRGFRLRMVGVTDHPREYAAGPDRPGVAFADLRRGGPTRIDAVPLALEFCHTRLASRGEHQVVGRLLSERCAAVGTEVRDEGDRFVIGPSASQRRASPGPSPSSGR